MTTPKKEADYDYIMRKKKRCSAMFWTGVILFVLTAAGHRFTQMMWSRIVAGPGGITLADTLSLLLTLPFLISALVMLSISLKLKLAIRQSLKKISPQSQATQDSMPTETHFKPSDIKLMLEKNQERHPSFSQLLRSCIDQIDRIAKQQADLRTLLDRYGIKANFLMSIPHTLLQAEQKILSNLMTVVNRGTIIQTEGDINTAAEKSFDDLINAVSLANEEIFEQIQSLLTAASDALSGNIISEDIDIEAWRIALRARINSSIAPNPFNQPQDRSHTTS